MVNFTSQLGQVKHYSRCSGESFSIEVNILITRQSEQTALLSVDGVHAVL